MHQNHFFLFLTPNTKMLVFKDQIDYDLTSERKKNQRKRENTKEINEHRV